MNKAFPRLRFPVAVLAQSPRAAALVVMRAPFHMSQKLHRETRSLARRSVVSEYIQRMLTQLQPPTLVHVNGTRWQVKEAPQTMTGAIAIAVRAASDFLGCAPTREGVVARLLDAYPDLELRLRPVADAKLRNDRVRAAQPLLAALIVAHAASVAHLVKHG